MDLPNIDGLRHFNYQKHDMISNFVPNFWLLWLQNYANKKLTMMRDMFIKNKMDQMIVLKNPNEQITQEMWWQILWK